MSDNNKVEVNYKKIDYDKLVDIADSIYAICRKTIAAGADPNIVLKNLQVEFKDFALGYPTVLQHMTLEGIYSSKVFKMFLMKLKESPWKNDDERLEWYTEYYIMLLKHLHRKSRSGNRKPEEWSKLRHDYLSKLRDNHKKFFDNCKKVEKEVEAENEDRLKERKKYLLNKVKELAKERSTENNTISKNDDDIVVCRGCMTDLSVISAASSGDVHIYEYCGADEVNDVNHFFCDNCFMGPAMKHKIEDYRLMSKE